MDHRYKTWRYWKEEWIYPFVIAVILALFIRTFVIQPFKIPSASMYPTLKIGDRIFVNKFLFGAKIPFINKTTPKVREPKRGDIIVFISVEDPEYPFPVAKHIRILGPIFFNKLSKTFKWYSGPRYIVKRLIGLPGEMVEIKGGYVYINDKILTDPPIIKSFRYFNVDDESLQPNPILVPENRYFVLGDNSANSVDSRFWGFVPKDHITGKAFVVWWPLFRIRYL